MESGVCGDVRTMVSKAAATSTGDWNRLNGSFEGRFASVTTARTGDTLTPLLVPGLVLQVDEILTTQD